MLKFCPEWQAPNAYHTRGRSDHRYGWRDSAKTESIKRIAQDYSDNVAGSMSVATTHGQARYVLPESISKFVADHPDVSLELKQGSPHQIAEMAAKGAVDFAIATEALQQYASLVTLPFFRWSHCVVVPQDHPLTAISDPTLEQVAQYPIVTYTEGFTGRYRIDEGFEARGLTPNYVVTAADADVIKTYVRRGLGVGIISTMAFEDQSDTDLVRIGSPNYFSPLLSCIAFRRGTFLRGFMFDFIEQLAPHSIRSSFVTPCLSQIRKSVTSFVQGSKFHAFSE